MVRFGPHEHSNEHVRRGDDLSMDLEIFHVSNSDFRISQITESSRESERDFITVNFFSWQMRHTALSVRGHCDGVDSHQAGCAE